MAHLIRLGNSFGVRIPQAIIQQVGFKKNMNLIFKITKDGLLISPEQQARDGWEPKFKSSKELKDLSLLDEFSNEWAR